METPNKILVDYAGERKPFKHFFSAVGYANVDYTYTQPTLKMYDYLSSFHNHFQYMRMHNILTAHGRGDFYLLHHGMDYGNRPGRDSSDEVDQVVKIDENGDFSYNWETVDRVYDILMEHQIRPIVETVYLPSCLRKSKEQPYIPADFNRWQEFLQDFIKHLEDRYGCKEVEKWYFEIWNEPDNMSYWVENPETFLALYDYMEAAIHQVNSKLKVGGPAVKQGEGAKKIFKAFLDHCSAELNYASGQFGTRVDFISVHCKGGWPDGYNPSAKIMFDSIKDYLEILQDYPVFKETEFINDESDVVWSGNQGIAQKSWLNFRNTHYFPGFVCKMVNTYCNLVEDKYEANLSIVDSDNCHLQWERSLFSGNRSQFTPLVEYPTRDIIRKSAFNAYVLLSRLGSERLVVKSALNGFGDKYGVLPTQDEKSLAIMVWNFEDGIEDDVNHRKITVEMQNISLQGKYRLIHYRIDHQHSSSYHTWRELGKPAVPDIEEIKEIRQKAGLTLYEPVKEIKLTENLSFELDMPMHSVSLLLLLPENEKSPAQPVWKKVVAEEGYNQNPQVFLKWKPDQDKDFLYYRIWRKEGAGDYQIISDNQANNIAVYTDMDVDKGKTYDYKIQAINASFKESELSEEKSIEV